MKPVTKIYRSITDFHAALSTAQYQGGFTNQYSHATTQYHVDAAGTATYEDADNRLLFGDRELAQKIEKAGVNATRIRLQRTRPQRQFYSAVVGAAPNVPAAIAGTPTSMINVRKAHVKQRMISIAYALNVNCDTSAKSVISTAANIISALMIIESRGILTNLYSLYCMNYHQKICAMVRVKSSGQPFDVLKMCYPMAHPSMKRRHFYYWLETTSGINSGFNLGYGYNMSASDIEAHIKKEGINYIDKVLTFDNCKRLSAEQIAELILK